MSDRRENFIPCHRCRWGAAPGHLTRCLCPQAVEVLRNMSRPDLTEEAAQWALPSMAATSGECPEYKAAEEAAHRGEMF